MANDKKFNELCEGFIETKEEKKTAVTMYESLKKDIVDLLGPDNTRTTKKFIAVYNNQNRDGFDLTKFKTDHPDIYLKYLKTTEYWTLNVTKRNELKRKK